MIVSNEPGYYAAGAFGIRIENLLVVEERTIPGGERPMLGFETLTLAPIDLSLVEPKLMDADEIAWLDDYHARVRKTLSPRVDASTRAWLAKATRRLGFAARPCRMPNHALHAAVQHHTPRTTWRKWSNEKSNREPMPR